MKILKITKIILCFFIVLTIHAQEIETTNCNLNFKEALFFLKGDENFPRDSIKAVNYLKPCANKGDADAQLLLGRLYLGHKTEEGNKKAFELIKKAAAQDNAIAIGDLGMLYKYGYGCKLNFNKARRLFKKAAKMGNERATYSLGYLYLKGFGNITQDYQKAVKWFKKSDYYMAKYWLGICYYKGYGVTKNNSKANEYLGTQFTENQEIVNTTDASTNKDEELLSTIASEEESTNANTVISNELLYGKWKGKLLKLDWSANKVEETYDIAVEFAYDSIKNTTKTTLNFNGEKIEDDYLKLDNTLYFANTTIAIPHESFNQHIPTVLENEVLAADLQVKTIGETTYLTGVVENYIPEWNEPGAPLRFVLYQENDFVNSTNTLSDEVLQALAAQEESFIKLYPNPFQNDLIISYQLEATSFVKVLFNDIYGNNSKTIEIGATQQKGAYKYYYNTSTLPKGTYIVSVITNDKKYTRIIIKK